MTLSNLRLIRDVAQHRSISKAARASGISQSAASQTVTDLERELAIDLFDRSTRPLSLTAAGRLLLDFSRDVIRREEQLQAELDDLRKTHRGVARLAAIYSVGLSEMSSIELRFKGLFPEGELAVSYLRPERVWLAVGDGSADLGLMSYAEPTREIAAQPWRKEEMIVAVSPEHRLASNLQVEPSALQGEPFIGFDEDLPIQSQINRYLRDRKVEVDTVMRFDNLQMIKEAVAHGAGISILPKRVIVSDLQANRLRALSLNPPDLFRPLFIIYRRRRAFTGVVAGLLNLLREEPQSDAA